MKRHYANKPLELGLAFTSFNKQKNSNEFDCKSATKLSIYLSLASESAKFTNALRIPYFEFDKKL